MCGEPEQAEESTSAPASAGVAQAHDGAFRWTVGRPTHLAPQLRATLPHALVARLDLDRLTPVNGSFVDDDLRQRHCDVLMRTRLDGHEAFVYVLVEHQSTPDPLMALRMLRYVVRIWERHLDENPKATRLPAVVPVVMYQGSRPWTAPAELRDLIDVGPETAEAADGLLPRLRFVLDDLTQVDESTLRERSLTPAGLLMLLLMKVAPGSRELDEFFLVRIGDLKEMFDAPDGRIMLGGHLSYSLLSARRPARSCSTSWHTSGPRQRRFS